MWLSWKHTCGNLNNGIKVPVICKNNRTKEILIVLLNKKNIPINTSHMPIILTHMSGSKKGIQSTVFTTNSSAGDIPSGLSIPNQKNITNRDKLSMGTSILIFFTQKKTWFTLNTYNFLSMCSLYTLIFLVVCLL